MYGEPKFVPSNDIHVYVIFMFISYSSLCDIYVI